MLLHLLGAPVLLHGLLLVDLLQSPDPLLMAPLLQVLLLHDDNVWQSALHALDFGDVERAQLVAQHVVVDLQHVAQVGLREEPSVVFAEVGNALELNVGVAVVLCLVHAAHAGPSAVGTGVLGLDVDDDELAEVPPRADGLERVRPVGILVQSVALLVDWVEDLYQRGDLGHQPHRRAPTHLLPHLWRYVDKVLVTDGSELDEVTVLVAVVVRAYVRRYELFALSALGDDLGVDEVVEHEGVHLVGEEEVESVRHLLHVYRL